MGLAVPGRRGWMLVIGMSLVPLVVGQVVGAIRNRGGRV
jgi:hypothetical protein